MYINLPLHLSLPIPTSPYPLVATSVFHLCECVCVCVLVCVYVILSFWFGFRPCRQPFAPCLDRVFKSCYPLAAQSTCQPMQGENGSPKIGLSDKTKT